MNPSNQTSASVKLLALINTVNENAGNHIKSQLVNLINDLIKNDFPSLLQLLYRIDVEEKKLKKILKENPGADTAPLIADMIIERQMQKIVTKNKFTAKNNSTPE